MNETLLAGTVFYHGTSARSWAAADDSGGLHVTTDLHDALNYAEETAIGDVEFGEVPYPIIVTIHGAEIDRLIADGSVSPLPDTGWEVGTPQDSDRSWERSLAECACIFLGGFPDEAKSALLVEHAFQIAPEDFLPPGQVLQAMLSGL